MSTKPDLINTALTRVLEQCLMSGFKQPLILTVVSHDGPSMAFHYEPASGGGRLATLSANTSEGQDLSLPITITATDDKKTSVFSVDSQGKISQR